MLVVDEKPKDVDVVSSTLGYHLGGIELGDIGQLKCQSQESKRDNIIN